ncbi:SpoIIAA family protein [Desulforhopalus sp. 52FAK]
MEDKILIVRPTEALEEDDFRTLAQLVDPFIVKYGLLDGLMIYTESFPGWDSFGALISHLKFVKDHQKKITRVAAVTDSGFLKIMPSIADHFTHAEIKHFSYNDKDDALDWLRKNQQ